MATFEIRDLTGHRRWAAASIDGITGSGGLGFCRLTFQLTLQIDPAEQPTVQLVSLSADLRVEGGGLAGRMQPPPQQIPVPVFTYSGAHTLQLELDLDRARLEAIEEARNGGDLELALMLYALLADGSGEPHLQTHQVRYPVNQGVWVRVLEELGYRRTMLLEIPVPDAESSPELASAVNLLAVAQQAMSRGEYRTAVAQCRDVLEEITRALGVSDDRAGFENARQMDKAARLQLVRRALGILTAPAHHRKDDVAASIEWSRTDAASVITMTAAVLSGLGAPGARPNVPAELDQSAG